MPKIGATIALEAALLILTEVVKVMQGHGEPRVAQSRIYCKARIGRRTASK